jgi:cell wall-associated NlpC family hydrolase
MTQPSPGSNTAGTLSPIQQVQPGPNTFRSTQGVTNVNTPIIGASATPPKLTTLVYAPKVQVIVDHNGVGYDVSADLVRCQLHREESSAATFIMSLVNPDWRYTPFTTNGVIPLFSRMDPITVYMTRINKIQVFTGFLDTVPYMQMYPGVVDFKATCTIKRLMHIWWNPALYPSLALITGYQGSTQVQGQDLIDGGLGGLLQSLLVNVGGLLPANIHIQNFPTNLWTFLSSQVTSLGILNSANMANFQHMVLGDNQTPAPGAAAGANPGAGLPGPTGSGTTFYIQQIIGACDAMGLGPSIQDNNQNAGLDQTGQTMQGSNDNAVKKAGQQLSTDATTSQTANRASDAAILGVACAAVETGGGAAILNLYNVEATGSQQCTPNDGPGTNGTSCGIFQQQNSWGTAAQRMNPFQAATMFFTNLITSAPNWSNMDPGAACLAVQKAAPGTYISQIDAAVPWATQQVKTARTAASGTGAIGAIGGAGALGALGGAAPSLNPSSVLGGAGIGSAGSTASALAGMPVPNSEGAINWGMTQIGRPYVWGAAGPASYDCSGFVQQCFKAIGVQLQHYSGSQYNEGTPVTGTPQRGDLCFPNGASNHVVIWLGNGTVLECGGNVTPSGVGISTVYFTPGGANPVCRICQNGGVNPAAPYTSPTTNGPGNPPGALPQQGGGTDPGSSGGSGGGGVPQNIWAMLYQPGTFQSQTANQFQLTKAFIDGEPLLNMIDSIAKSGLREWCSAPNGDFVAYYPDYWGLNGGSAVLTLEDIELKDVRIDLSDDPLTTHVYIEGDLSQVGGAANPTVAAWINTTGVCTVENSWLFQRLIQIAPGTFAQGATGDSIMRTYGIRPLNKTFSMAGSNELELLLAIQVFLEKWAQQYQTSVSMTFMPELFPGMRVMLASRNLSVYCHAVTHTCDYSSGFSTQAVIMCPSNGNGLSAMSTVTIPVPGPDGLGQGGGPQQAIFNPRGQGTAPPGGGAAG